MVRDEKVKGINSKISCMSSLSKLCFLLILSHSGWDSSESFEETRSHVKRTRIISRWCLKHESHKGLLMPRSFAESSFTSFATLCRQLSTTIYKAIYVEDVFWLMKIPKSPSESLQALFTASSHYSARDVVIIKRVMIAFECTL